jgi:hypothetical protein
VNERSHCCDQSCVCPSCEKPLFYSAAFNQHACSDPNCEFAAGTPDQLELWMKRRHVHHLAKES